MNLILEIDGPVLDIALAWHSVHLEAAASVGWSALDQPTFWRLTRKQGRNATLLPGASPLKIKKYEAYFAERIEADEVAKSHRPNEDADRTLASLSAKGRVNLVTLGSNLAARRSALDEFDLARFAENIVRLSDDPRKRPGELQALAGGEKRCLVAAAGDSMVRAAAEAGITVVGVSRGSCSVDRLYRAGAGVVYKDIEKLRAAIITGSEELTRAGFLPPTLG